jgi:hypothetical protein
MSNDKPKLLKCSFTFEQESNCNSATGEFEDLTIECESSLGIDFDKGCYYVLKTNGWSIDNVNDLQLLFDRINKVINESND